MNNDKEIKEYLTKYKKITVVGISDKPNRASYGVSRYLINNDYDVDGVHPNGLSVHDRPVYKKLEDVPHDLEIVDVFRASEYIPDLVDELIPLHPKVLWLQEGITHPEAEEKARKAGIKVISDRCILKEHRRLITHPLT